MKDIIRMLLKKFVSFYFTFLYAVFIACQSYSCDIGTHQHEDSTNKAKITSFYVSDKCRSFFSQPDYTYSFPFVDEDDRKILNTLSKVFGTSTYSNVTKGTYSIAIDYDPSPQSSKVYRQTRYLVSNDNFKTSKVITEDGYSLFRSDSTHAPKYYDLKGGEYHMENALMTSLNEDSDAILHDIFTEIPKKSRILGVCIKLYSSYDCCPACRLNILNQIQDFQKMLDNKIRAAEKFKVSNQAIPFMIHGLMVRPYGKILQTFLNDKCENIEAQYWVNLFNQTTYYSFRGKINGQASQNMMPVYIQMQQSTEINSDKTIFLKQ
jgi:hypothetical protein